MKHPTSRTNLIARRCRRSRLRNRAARQYNHRMTLKVTPAIKVTHRAPVSSLVFNELAVFSGATSISSLLLTGGPADVHGPSVFRALKTLAT